MNFQNQNLFNLEFRILVSHKLNSKPWIFASSRSFFRSNVSLYSGIMLIILVHESDLIAVVPLVRGCTRSTNKTFKSQQMYKRKKSSKYVSYWVLITAGPFITNCNYFSKKNQPFFLRSFILVSLNIFPSHNDAGPVYWKEYFICIRIILRFSSLHFHLLLLKNIWVKIHVL